MINFEQWEGFEGRIWKEEVNVRDFIQKNYTPYNGDVIHFDTGWFGVDWQCDYAFAADRFDNPRQMLTDLRSQGFRTCHSNSFCAQAAKVNIQKNE